MMADASTFHSMLTLLMQPKELGMPQVELEETADTVEPRSKAELLIPPHVSAKLADLHQMNDQLLENGLNRLDSGHLRKTNRQQSRPFRSALSNFINLLSQGGLIKPQLKRSVLAQMKEESNTAVLLGVYHRFNCMLLRGLAGKSNCKEQCCCDCNAAPAGVECVFLFLQGVQKKQESFKATKN